MLLYFGARCPFIPPIFSFAAVTEPNSDVTRCDKACDYHHITLVNIYFLSFRNFLNSISCFLFSFLVHVNAHFKIQRAQAAIFISLNLFRSSSFRRFHPMSCLVFYPHPHFVHLQMNQNVFFCQSKFVTFLLFPLTICFLAQLSAALPACFNLKSWIN